MRLLIREVNKKIWFIRQELVCLSDEPIFRGMIILKSVISAMLTHRLMSRLGLLWLFSDISQNTAIYIEHVAIDSVRGVGCQEHSGSAQF